MVEADGELFRRNRHDLKPTQENPPADRPEPVPQPASESYVAADTTPAPSPVARRTSSQNIKWPARFADYVCKKKEKDEHFAVQFDIIRLFSVLRKLVFFPL